MRGLDARIGVYNDATIAAALLAKGYTVGPWSELSEVGAPPPPPVRMPGQAGTGSNKGKRPPPHAFTHNVKDWYGKQLEAKLLQHKEAEAAAAKEHESSLGGPHESTACQRTARALERS